MNHGYGVYVYSRNANSGELIGHVIGQKDSYREAVEMFDETELEGDGDEEISMVEVYQYGDHPVVVARKSYDDRMAVVRNEG